MEFGKKLERVERASLKEIFVPIPKQLISDIVVSFLAIILIDILILSIAGRINLVQYFVGFIMTFRIGVLQELASVELFQAILIAIWVASTIEVIFPRLRYFVASMEDVISRGDITAIRSILYENGICVKTKNNEILSYHFGEIESLMENVSKSGRTGYFKIRRFRIFSRRSFLRNRKRDHLCLTFISRKENNLRRVFVADAMADALSVAYTNWMIKEHNIVKQNFDKLNLSFGNSLKLENGMLMNGNKNIHLRDISRVEIKKEIKKHRQTKVFNLEFFAFDKTGSEIFLSILKVPWNGIENVDLLFYILRKFNGQKIEFEDSKGD